MTRRHRYRRRPGRAAHTAGSLPGHLVLIVVTFGIWLAVLLIWGAIALGVHIRRRYGKRGMWIYVGAWCIAAALGALFPNDPPPPTHTPPITVTVTVTSGAAP